MQVQINTDRNIQGHEALAVPVRASVESALSRFSEHITRVEVHLGDENAGKHGAQDKRCMMEARIEGRKPLAVTHYAETVALAIDGATDKLVRVVESTLGRQHDRRTHAADPMPPDPDSQE